MLIINDRSEYDYCISRGYEPLLDWRRFTLDIRLRVDIQHEVFGASSFQKENQKFYQWIWERKPHFCEETGACLYDYSAVHVSHIASKGSDRRMACDPRNVNLLTYYSHNRWEYGNHLIRSRMNIYLINMYILNILRNDYNKLR